MGVGGWVGGWVGEGVEWGTCCSSNGKGISASRSTDCMVPKTELLPPLLFTLLPVSAEAPSTVGGSTARGMVLPPTMNRQPRSATTFNIAIVANIL